MKILFYDFTLPYLLKDCNYPVGGWAVELNAWIQGLTLQKHQVGVLTWKGANDFVGKPLNFDLVESYNPDKGIRTLRYFYMKIPALYKAAKNYKPDVMIEACAARETGVIAYIAKKINVPFIYRVANDMDVNEKYKEHTPIFTQIPYHYGLRNSKLILCQNQYQYDMLKSKYPKKPLFIILNPFYTASFLDNFSSDKSNQYIAWLGVFRKEKNMGLLYQIASQLTDIPFKIAGMPLNFLDKETETAIERLKQCPNAEFVGYLKRTEVPQFLNSAAALLNTSYYEGLSNTFLEAFAVGTPVIAPSTVDPNNIISKNKLGLIAKTPDEIPYLIRKLKDDRMLYEHIRESSRNYILTNHDPEKLAVKLVDTLLSKTLNL